MPRAVLCIVPYFAWARLGIAAALALARCSSGMVIVPGSAATASSWTTQPNGLWVYTPPGDSPDWLGDLPWSRRCDQWEPFGQPYLSGGFRRYVLEKPA
jgi:hypothetical protein